jgi:very-short-patch-repair endonuclease
VGEARQISPEGWGRSAALAVAALAARQFGVVARAQLAALGIGQTTIDRWLACGRLHRIHPGVYAVGHRSLSREGRFLAAVFACGDDAVLSHRAAAALWGFGPQAQAEVTAPVKRKLARSRAELPEDERTTLLGIAVTTVERTLVDLASDARIERLVREADVQRLLSWPRLERLLDRYPRKRGTRKLRALAASARPITRSELEDRFRGLVLGANLPTPRFNTTLELNERRLEVDAWWPSRRLVVELDGHTYHANRAAFEADRERDRMLQASGIKVVRITWRQLREQRAAVARDLQTLLS